MKRITKKNIVYATPKDKTFSLIPTIVVEKDDSLNCVIVAVVWLFWGIGLILR